MKFRLLLCALPLFGLAAAAEAQLRCDCERIVGTCAAEVGVQGTLIEVTTDQSGCARVDYLIDGQPFVSLVVDGEARENWTAPTAVPRTSIESCRVCAQTDQGAGADPRAFTPLPAPLLSEPAPFRPLIQVQPAYPPAAEEAGVQGWVELAVTVAGNGVVERAEVLRAEPLGVFEDAAWNAVLRWRYPSIGEARTIVERIEFRVPSAPVPAAFEIQPPPLDRLGAAQRNACVREDGRFNYGDRVDVSLINACAEPLAVFGCAIGTGQYQGRWTCTAFETTDTALAPQTHEASGASSRAQPADGLTAELSNAHVLSRAPNSEYWWLACSLDDAECLEAGRAWLTALAGQPASADPQSRSRVALARSF